MTTRRRVPTRMVRRDVPLRVLIAGACALIAFILIGLGHRAIAAGLPAAGLAWAEARLYSATASAGLVLRNVEVVGRNETARAAVMTALGADIGMPILAVDLAAAQARLSAEGWIAHVAIERRLPDTLAVTIEERRPAALWQMDGQFALIDRSGVVITRGGLGRFRDLPQLVGPDAPQNAAPLLDALDAAPELRARLDAATRVGGRRWSLHFVGGLEAKLPEENVSGAIERLARMERARALFARDLRQVDLRVPDRIVVRPPQRSGPATPMTGRL